MQASRHLDELGRIGGWVRPIVWKLDTMASIAGWKVSFFCIQWVLNEFWCLHLRGIYLHRYGHKCARLGDTVVIAGGADERGDYVPSTMVLDLVTKQVWGGFELTASLAQNSKYSTIALGHNRRWHVNATFWTWSGSHWGTNSGLWRLRCILWLSDRGEF